MTDEYIRIISIIMHWDIGFEIKYICNNIVNTVLVDCRAPLDARIYAGTVVSKFGPALQWRHNERDGVSNHQRLDCLLTRLLGADQRNHQSSASLAFVKGIHRWPVDSPHKGPVTRKMFPFNDVIMLRGHGTGIQVMDWYAGYGIVLSVYRLIDYHA